MQEAEMHARTRREQEQVKAAQARDADITRMRAGTKSITTFEDAVAVYEAVDGFSLASAPKIRPDGRYYFLSGAIDQAEDNAASFVALANNGPASALRNALVNGGPGEIRYFHVRLPKAMEAKYYELAKIGRGFSIVGKYSSNLNYKTVGGEKKMMPVFDAQYFEFWSADKLR